MILAILTLGLLCARPAQAQGGYPGGSDYPGSGGGWVLSSSAYIDSNGFIYLRAQAGTSDTKSTYPPSADSAS